MSVTTTIGPLDRAELELRIDEFLAIASDQLGEYWTRDNFVRELPSK